LALGLDFGIRFDNFQKVVKSATFAIKFDNFQKKWSNLPSAFAIRFDNFKKVVKSLDRFKKTILFKQCLKPCLN